MQTFFVLAVGAALLGTIGGSFLNAILFRFNTGHSALSGRSKCMQCGHTLHTLDLIPIVSWVLLWGRCRYCGARISPQYPLVELTAAGLSLWVYLLYPVPFYYAFWLLTWLVVLFIVVYDLRHMIIPWSASLTLLALSFASLFLGGVPTLWALLSGPLLAFPLFLLSLLSWGKWMGWADSLFELSLGWLLGLLMGAGALLLAVWIGAIVGVLLIGLSKRVTIHSEMPFAPSLALGAAIAFFLHVNIFATLLFF